MIFNLGVAMFGALQVGFMLHLLTMLPIWADATIAATLATGLSMALEYDS